MIRAGDERSAALLSRAAGRIPMGGTVLLPLRTAESAALSGGATRPEVNVPSVSGFQVAVSMPSGPLPGPRVPGTPMSLSGVPP